jgi:hypothetical protein
MGSVIRLAAVVLSGFVLVGFAFFCVDELDRGSRTQQEALSHELQGLNEDPAAIARTPADEKAREAANGTFREVVDDVNDVLLGPFVDVVESDDAWVARGVPTVLALLLYGLGLGFLANTLPARRSHRGDWQSAES